MKGAVVGEENLAIQMTVLAMTRASNNAMCTRE